MHNMRKSGLGGIVVLAAMLCVLPACSDGGDEEKMDLSGESLGQDTEQELDQDQDTEQELDQDTEQE